MNNLSEEIIASLRAQCKAYFYPILTPGRAAWGTARKKPAGLFLRMQ